MSEIRFSDMQFFGVWSKFLIGHFMFAASGCALPRELHLVPESELDAVFPPHLKGEPQTVPTLAYHRGCTILAMWDRSADNRGKGNAAFIRYGQFTLSEMMDAAREHFPSITERLELFKVAS